MVGISWAAERSSRPQSRCAAEASSFPSPRSTKGKGAKPRKGAGRSVRTKPMPAGAENKLQRRGGLLLVHQNDRMGLRELIIQQTCPSQIPSKGMAWFLSVHWLYKILRVQYTSKTSQKPRSGLGRSSSATGFFLCVVSNTCKPDAKS